jgi:hypothetical protein
VSEDVTTITREPIQSRSICSGYDNNGGGTRALIETSESVELRRHLEIFMRLVRLLETLEGLEVEM